MERDSGFLCVVFLFGSIRLNTGYQLYSRVCCSGYWILGFLIKEVGLSYFAIHCAVRTSFYFSVLFFLFFLVKRQLTFSCNK